MSSLARLAKRCASLQVYLPACSSTAEIRAIRNPICNQGRSLHAQTSQIASEGSEGVSAEELEQQRKASVNKLLYRSRQRGFLEMDLLVGQWAEENVGKMKPEEFDLFAVVLDQENPDLFKWLTGQLEPPDNMLTNSTYRALRQHVIQKLEEKSHFAAHGKPGKDWVRGWDDWKAPEPAKTA